MSPKYQTKNKTAESMLEFTSVMSKAEIKKQETEISMFSYKFLRLLPQILFLEYFQKGGFYFKTQEE